MNNNNNNNYPFPVVFHNINDIPQAQTETDFVLTINTNQVIEEGSDREREVHDQMELLLQTLAGFTRDDGVEIDPEDGPVGYFDFTNQGVATRVASNDPTVDADHDYTEDGIADIDQIEFFTAYERTPEGQVNAGRYHVHAYFRVKHSSNIRIDYNRLNDIVKKYMRLVNVRPYVWLSYAHSTFDNIIRYLRKDMQNNTGRNRHRNNNNNNNNYSDTEDEDDDF